MTKKKDGTSVVVEYSSNNSGGGWWLKDKDWKALEKAGWKVEWSGKYHLEFKNGYTVYDKDGTPKLARGKDSWAGEDGRWLGALAKTAWKVFPSITDALKEFEAITRQQVSDEGCNCCGAPHRFEWWKQAAAKSGMHVDHEYASGESLLKYLYPGRDIPGSLRDTLDAAA